ncbi:uncharacterized protein [Blastocystis hominis]|uniref:L-type lectin-like domain-containing protein n=1 Tax=Blastocystis hominis TaxID=12968 RepID=D8MBI8_BLAHO|nr:uncharacterized protein [Blastocystis hominis]CBK25427.2 unnamed protein product [Blastocystis hominis]|eukprot:XP_012899475.1 uncharacterized protein [Blastocystis hominis]
MKKLVVFILSLSVIAIAQTISEVNSFAAPFKNYGWAGNRKIKGWTCGGDASIKEYFVRLTPDRQSKSGFCWNDKPLNSNKWLTTVKFRISGQGETLFGDGMTIFFTTQNVHTAGPMHGSNDKFIGFSVDLSTYRNPEYYRFHRDISLYVGNNTSESAYYPDREHEGCFSSYRFYEKRQDFSVENAARIQISYDGDLQRVVVRSDHNNRGYYDDCFSAKVDLPAEWWRNAYIGVSASTGDLADNHDVLEISTVVGVSSLENEEAITQKEREDAFRATLAGLLKEEGLEAEKLNPAELALASLVKALSDAELDELEKLKRELEHSMSCREGGNVET